MVGRKGGSVRRFAAAVAAGVGLGLLGGWPLAVQGQAPNGSTTVEAPPAPPTPAVPADEYGRGSPRRMVVGWLEACHAGNYARAVAYLDTRRIPASRREKEGLELARQLCIVVERTTWIDPETVSDLPEGDKDDGLIARRESVATIPVAGSTTAFRLLLERVPREDNVQIWKVAAESLSRVPSLYEEFGYGALLDVLPAPFFDLRFLQIQLWQWVGLVALLPLSLFAGRLLGWLAGRILRGALRRAFPGFTDGDLRGLVRPLGVLLAAALFGVGSQALALSVRSTSIIGGFAKAVGFAALAWMVSRLVDLFTRRLEVRTGGAPPATGLLPLGRRTAKVFIFLIGGTAVLQNLGFDVSSLLAGLGIGGLAVALAGQRTIEHLFGGVTLIADQPVRVGDFCRFGDKMGTVEDIGLRSTRVRTVDRTVISIPNGAFSSMEIENFSRRDRIRLTTTLSLRYETSPDQLRWLLVELKRMLLSHPRLADDPVRVRFVAFGPSSLDVEVLAYVLTTDHAEFLAVREDVYLRVLDIVAAAGTGFAFPSQTVYRASDGGLDPERRAAAERKVAEWREFGDLWLPQVPESDAAALRGTLAWPPQGSASNRRDREPEE